LINRKKSGAEKFPFLQLEFFFHITPAHFILLLKYMAQNQKILSISDQFFSMAQSRADDARRRDHRPLEALRAGYDGAISEAPNEEDVMEIDIPDPIQYSPDSINVVWNLQKLCCPR